MSWAEDIWSQDNIINNGYPFVTDTGTTESYCYLSVKSVINIQKDKNQGYPFNTCAGIAKKYDYISVKSVWTIQEDENDGYPVITDFEIDEKYDYTSVKSIWKFKSDVNFGFPYIIDMAEEKPNAPVFRTFSMSGLGAGFKKTSTSTMLTGKQTVNFCFPERKNIVFHLKFSKGKIDLTE